MTDIPAADATRWNTLSIDDQNRINQIMRDTGLILPTDSVVGGSSPYTPTPSWHIPNPVCRLGCNAAEATAIAACAASLSGPAVAACIAVAHKAADYCRSRC
jgi:hypothetical protein